jgi:hypothetical protein
MDDNLAKTNANSGPWDVVPFQTWSHGISSRALQLLCLTVAGGNEESDPSRQQYLELCFLNDSLAPTLRCDVL